MSGPRRFHVEQDRAYEFEQCPVTKVWRRTKVVLLKTWTAYEFVGSPAYQTPVFRAKDEAGARAFVAEQEGVPA